MADPTSMGKFRQDVVKSIADDAKRVGGLLAGIMGDVSSRLDDPAWLKGKLDSDDLTVRSVRANGADLFVAYMEPLVDRKELLANVGRTLALAHSADPRRALPDVAFTAQASDVEAGVLAGKVAVLMRGARDVALVDVHASPTRSVSQPTTGASLLGPKQAFTEDISTSLALVRRILATPKLRVHQLDIGTLTHTKVAVVWVDGVASPGLVDRVVERLGKVQVDTILNSEDVIEVAFHRTWSPVPTEQRTERPDHVARALALGRVAVLVDNDPFAILVPATLGALIKYTETAFGAPSIVALVRLLRVMGGLLSILIPATYVALLGVDPTLVPAETLVAVARTRVGVPYPVFFETMGLLVLLDMVIEASYQAPSPIGQTVTVVGGLIIGQAAAQAHLGSQLVVIVAAVTGIGTLLITDLPFAYAMRIAKYPLTGLAALFGFYGIAIGLIAGTIHLVSLESLDAPFTAPFGPVRPRSLGTYSILARLKGQRIRRPATYRPPIVRRQPQGGLEP